MVSAASQLAPINGKNFSSTNGFCRTKAVKQNFSFNITCWMDFWVMSMSWTADLSVIWAWCQDVTKFGVCPRYLPDWALVTEWRGRGRGKKRRGRRRREGRRKGTRWRRTRKSNCIKNDLINVKIWCNTYPTSVATRFCALLTISKILTVRSDEQVASLLP